MRREMGYQEGISILLSLLGIVAVREQQFARAYALFSEALSAMRGLMSEWGMSVNVGLLPDSLARRGSWLRRCDSLAPQLPCVNHGKRH